MLNCQGGGRGWSDQYYRPIKTPFECVKGCIEPPTSRDTNTNTRTITNNFFIDGVRVKCTTSKHCCSLHLNFWSAFLVETEKDSQTKTILGDHDFYCAVNSTNGSNRTVIDKSCENACRTLTPPLPDGVRMFRVSLRG